MIVLFHPCDVCACVLMKLREQHNAERGTLGQKCDIWPQAGQTHYIS